MTTEIDPVRWTQSSDDAPELLRAPFAAAAKEGPSPAQMRMLALKLAAVSTGTAVAATASTAHASTTLGGGAAASGALPLAKVVLAFAVVGATALGGVALFAKPSEGASAHGAKLGAPSAQTVLAASKAPEMVAPKVARELAVEPALEAPAPAEAMAQTKQVAPSTTEAPTVAVANSAMRRRENAVHGGAKRNSASKVTQGGQSAAGATQEAHESPSKVDVPSEVELLRRARATLSARPREAFALTEQHREHYPRGVFAQERDALAIEALLRTGDTDEARQLAQSFVRAHPNSPHAHRFRETLGLR